MENYNSEKEKNKAEFADLFKFPKTENERLEKIQQLRKKVDNAKWIKKRCNHQIHVLQKTELK